jgi:7-cyano-7-deazaguanine synthase in queuosine biosynthesis
MLYQMKHDGVAARLIYLNFGTPAAVRERAAVKLVALSLGYPLDTVDLSGFADLQLGYLWPSENIFMPEADTGSPSQAAFPIGREDRRLVSGFGVIAAVGLYATALLDTPSMSLALTRDQFDTFPALTEGLAGARRMIEAVNPGITPEVVTPLAALSKVEVVQRAVALGVPIDMTWSCALGYEQPCSRCERCIARDEAIAAAGADIASVPAIDPPPGFTAIDPPPGRLSAIDPPGRLETAGPARDDQHRLQGRRS